MKRGPKAPWTARRAVGGPKGPPALRRSYKEGRGAPWTSSIKYLTNDGYCKKRNPCIIVVVVVSYKYIQSNDDIPLCTNINFDDILHSSLNYCLIRSM